MADLERKKMGAKLKEIREYLGYSQDEVAKHLNLPRPAISLIESGKRKLESIELSKLSKLFNTPIDVLTGKEKAKSNSPPQVGILQRAVSELGKEDLDEVLKFAEYLKARSKLRGKNE